MRTVPWLTVRNGVMRGLGYDPATDLVGSPRLGEIAAAANDAMDYAWHYVPEGWPELREVQERTAVDYVIPLERTGSFSPIAQIFGVTNQHPHTARSPQAMRFRVTASGLVLGEETATCFIEFQQPAPRFTSAAWITATAYAATDLILFTDGDCYECLEAHTSGTFSTDLAAGKWEKQSFPAFLSQAIQAGVIASLRETDGQSGRASLLQQTLRLQLDRVCERYDFSRQPSPCFTDAA